MKSKNIKIKHRKYNLYNKKKSKGKQALAVILTIVVLAALGVIGFGLGRPLMEYFQGKNNSSTADSGSAWTPPESAVTSDAGTSDSSAATEDASSESSEHDVEIKEAAVRVLPAGALRNADALNSAVAAAKADGYTSVMVTLKNSSGSFMYKSDIAGIKDSEAVTGTLTAKQITDLITAADMTPVARICTLRDSVSGNYIEDIKYMTSDGYTWLDAAPTKGGKSWLSPFAENTSKYIADITAELAAAGFKTVILADVIFPKFLNADDAYLGHLPIRDPAARLEALWKMIGASSDAAKANGAKLMLEMTAADLEAADKLSTTAEAAGDKTKLRTVEILVQFTAESGSEYISAKTLTGKMNSMYGGIAYSVQMSGGLSESLRNEVSRAFRESDITVFSE
ncbi:MAG: hypothetical protein J6A16_09010 [Oscillospiraceae bacterium]|nr:hypothetical protein [Oscillospiraceae bacterium]